MTTLPTLPTNAHAPKFVGNVGNLFSIAHIAHRPRGHAARMRPGRQLAGVVGHGRLPTTPRLDANGNHLQLRGGPARAMACTCIGGVTKNFLFFPHQPVSQSLMLFLRGDV